MRKNVSINPQNPESRKANTPASDIIRLAVAQFLASHTRTDDMIAAVIEGRKQGL